MLAFNSVHVAFFTCCLLCFEIGFFVLLCGLFFKTRPGIVVACIIMLASALTAGSAWAKHWWTVGRYPVLEQTVDWKKYVPYSANNLLVETNIADEYQMKEGEYPRVNGAYALYPIYAAMAQKMYPRHIAEEKSILSTDGSPVIYEELMEGKRDLIFALAPSRWQEDIAKKNGVKYELTPFCKEAFVFYVNAKNPIDNLTTEQIKGIYSGKITDWKEVGAEISTQIKPFQRNAGSGSQTTLERIMGDTPIMSPITEDRVGDMGGIINATASYRNYNAAIGFSFRYYATEMLKNKQIKFLSIDGVAPTVENIRNGSYPFVTTAYMVTAQPRTENVRKIINFMRSPEGRDLIEKTGYVAVDPTEDISEADLPETMRPREQSMKWRDRFNAKLEEARQNGKDVEIVFLGDSITHHWDDPGRNVFAREFAKYHTLNLGFGGDKVQNMLWVIQNGDFFKYASNPKLIVMMIGTNNCDVESPEDIAAGIKYGLKLLRECVPSAKIVLYEIFPRGFDDGDYHRVFNEKVNTIIRNYGNGINVFCESINGQLTNPDGTFPEGMMMGDFVHPRAPAYEIWAKDILKYYQMCVE